MSSSSGTIFRITTFGESHGPGVGVIIDGCPAGIRLDSAAIATELQRRRPGQSKLTTPRQESDEFEILSGVYEGVTLGTPLTLFIRNQNVKSGDYLRWSDTYRPSHADYTYDAKYGYRTPIGGGRASARETAGRVAAGAVAAQILSSELGINTIAWVDSVADQKSDVFKKLPTSRDEVDASEVRCPDSQVAAAMTEKITAAKAAGDSLGGVIGVVVHNVPPGLGDPVFDKLEAELAKAALSIPACKGFESGSGFAGTELSGSQHNDHFYPKEENSYLSESPLGATADDRVSRIFQAPEVATRSNHSGGIQGGISNGMPLLMRLAFKPVATIGQEQPTVNENGEEVTLKAGGRHDPCVLPRAVPIVEAMVNLTLVDAYLRQRALSPEWWLRYRRTK